MTKGRGWTAIGSTMLALAISTGARAQGVVPAAPAAPAGPESESSVTVYAGYRFGGSFTDVTSGKTWELTEGPAFSVAADFGIDRRTQWELFVSYRNASMKASGFSPTADNIRLGIGYYHFGGTYFFDQVGKGGYVVGGLGLTNFTPGSAGLSAETRFSLNLGVGYMIPLGKHVGLKLEGRGYATLVDSSGGFFCSGGCVVQIKGTTFTQAEAMAGIAARF